MATFTYVLCACLYYVREKWIDFTHLVYTKHGPYVADACKIMFGSVPNLTNYGNICCAVMEKKCSFCLYLVQTSTTRQA